ncbi:MAG: tellurium resistance protein TerC [Planctomycetes bacterium]|nr:tellurium resistance protein TerC [Planctomycetota bacterium]
MLILLQAVLGFDNLLYISMESQRVAERDRARVRKQGILLALVLRIVLLFVVTQAIGYFAEPFAHLDTAWLHVKPSGHSLIVLVGGGFVLYTAVKAIWHMLAPAEVGGRIETAADPKRAVLRIAVMNVVFSFDSILGAIALTDSFTIMAISVVVSSLMMLWLADHVSAFLQKNRMYEVLGLFVLLIVGVMLVSEGGHLAHVELFGHPVEAMSKSTFYFVIAVLVIVDLVQGRYQKKLLSESAKGG